MTAPKVSTAAEVLWVDEANGLRVVREPSGLCVPEWRAGADNWLGAEWELMWPTADYGGSWEEVVCGMAQDAAAAREALRVERDEVAKWRAIAQQIVVALVAALAPTPPPESAVPPAGEGEL